MRVGTGNDFSELDTAGTARQPAGLPVLFFAEMWERADTLGKVGAQWLLAVYLLHTVGELFLSPIGLSMVTRLAPAHLAAEMMGIWFTATAIASYLAGTLGNLLAGSGIPLYRFWSAGRWARVPCCSPSRRCSAG
jgi:dipeptide/tripeptide permease